ncbi:hypothetical protein [Nitrospira calida]|jgi:hypothetical protein
MPNDDSPLPDVDWRLTTFEGARREQLRRWSALPLEDILQAMEEMQEMARRLGAAQAGEADRGLDDDNARSA